MEDPSMTNLKFDSLDLRVLARFDDSAIVDGDGEVAVIDDVKIGITRIGDDRFEFLIKFPELDFPVVVSRSRTLDTLGIKADES
jgi:hypothetical protein